MGECLDVIFGKVELLPSNVSNQSSTNDKYGFLCKVNIISSKPGTLNCEYLPIDAELSH